MRVTLDNLTKHFGRVVAVDNVSLEVNDGEFIALLGPSGCGKTTTLLMIAGIYKPTHGVIRFDEKVVNRLEPRDRNVGMVFQSYALYPHMSVYENLTFPMRLKGTPKEAMRKRAEDVSEMLGIPELLNRKPGQLSGGQQQRVALGRALAKEPDILLFDEPLSNLDARLRLSMRAEIRQLQVDLGITAIYVTHDQVEAMTMADRIAVIDHGQLQAYCTPDELYDQPRTLFIARFVGNPPMNMWTTSVVKENGAYHARSEDLDLVVPPEYGEKSAGKGDVLLGIRAEDIEIVDERSADAVGKVRIVAPLGRDDLLTVPVGGVDINLFAEPSKGYKTGDTIPLSFNTHKVQFFDPETERSLLWS
ncbi:MAG: ABC transporter ATP-binding protein [Anaerolineae bacterium]